MCTSSLTIREVLRFFTRDSVVEVVEFLMPILLDRGGIDVLAVR